MTIMTRMERKRKHCALVDGEVIREAAGTDSMDGADRAVDTSEHMSVVAKGKTNGNQRPPVAGEGKTNADILIKKESGGTASRIGVMGGNSRKAVQQNSQCQVEKKTFSQRLARIEATWGYTYSHYKKVLTLRPCEHLELLENDLGIKDVARNFGERIRALEIQVGLEH